jgi:hypothetical protein
MRQSQQPSVYAMGQCELISQTTRMHEMGRCEDLRIRALASLCWPILTYAPSTKGGPTLVFPIHKAKLHVGSTDNYDNVCYMGSYHGYLQEDDQGGNETRSIFLRSQERQDKTKGIF